MNSSTDASQAEDNRPKPLRSLIPVLPLVLACSYVFWRAGRYALATTDEGFILSHSYMILHGKLPHSEVYSPRPLGSAVIHIFDLLLPGPTFLLSRAIALFEFAATALIVSVMVFRQPLSRWTPLQSSLCAITALVSLHTFPLMAWHTVDGVLLVVSGFALLQSGLTNRTPARVLGGLLLVGASLVVKQSFAPALPLVYVYALYHLIVVRPRRIKLAAVGTLAMGAVPLAYFAWVCLGGGYSDMRAQLGGAQSVDFFAALRFGKVANTPDVKWLVVVSILAAMTVLITKWPARSDKRDSLSVWLVGGRIAVTALLIWAIFHSKLAYDGGWGIWILYLCIVVTVASSIAIRRLDFLGLFLCALAWMSSLSWGYPVPDLASGLLTLYILQRVWEGTVVPTNLMAASRITFAGVALVSLIFATLDVTHERRLQLRSDEPLSQLVVDLGTVSPKLKGIVSSAVVAKHLNDIKECVRAHPAQKVAVVQSTSIAYPLFNLDPGYTATWLDPAELLGSGSRFFDESTRLKNAGNYLVMFDLHSDPQLVASGKYVVQDPATAVTPDGYIAEFGKRLGGTTIQCGGWVARYDPVAHD